MFINKVQIRNFRLFGQQDEFEVHLKVPDGITPGRGLNAFVGENGCGKTALLDAIALPLVSYKADNFSLQDINDPTCNVDIKVLSEKPFTVSGTMPKGSFESKGILFKANVRARESKAYLSSIIVSDQLFIRVDPNKPKDNSPDLRLNVNNPFKGRRFDENDVLILDKSRTYQTRLGTFSPTRFDRLMEDFDFQYLKGNDPVPDIHLLLTGARDKAENTFLKEAVAKFKEMSGQEISLNLIDNWRPFSKSFLGVQKGNNQQIPLSMIGSGYEMIFSLLLGFYLSRQSGKQLICLIDEPELHLHPSVQERFVEILIEFAKEAQIILTTHSPLFVKQLMANDTVTVQVLDKDGDIPHIIPLSTGALPYLSSNEVNYLAFKLATVEYHDELYGHIQEIQEKYGEAEMITYLNSNGQANTKQWNPEREGQLQGAKNVPLQVFIRNKTHHPENRAMQSKGFSQSELKHSIDAMIDIIRSF